MDCEIVSTTHDKHRFSQIFAHPASKASPKTIKEVADKKNSMRHIVPVLALAEGCHCQLEKRHPRDVRHRAHTYLLLSQCSN